MKLLISLFLIASMVISCNSKYSKQHSEKPYTRWVGDIEPNPSIDSESFKLCFAANEVIQYFNNGGGLEYEGEKMAIIKTFEKEYNPKISKIESGVLRIRFIVNCKGEAGRYRLLGMDTDYNEMDFDTSISDQILSITKSLRGWKPKIQRGKERDYYQFLSFKINDGHIEKILP